MKLLLKYKISGIIISNTTESNRDNLKDILQISKRRSYLENQLKKNLINLISKFYNLLKGKIHNYRGRWG